MSELEENVNRLLAQRDAQEATKNALARAIEEAKPAAFAAFEAGCVEAADLLIARGVGPEISKQAVVGYHEERKVLTRRGSWCLGFDERFNGGACSGTSRPLGRQGDESNCQSDPRRSTNGVSQMAQDQNDVFAETLDSDGILNHAR
jgi:hypothetical protein